MTEMMQWRCKHGHILGFIKTVDGVRQLMLLRNALDMDVENPKEVDLLGPLSGSMSVRCSVEGCDDVRRWSISVDGLLYLFLRLENKRAFEFSVKLLEKAGKLNEAIGE